MIERYEYGAFNANKEKIMKANGIEEDIPEWEWLWNAPIEIRLYEEDMKLLVDKINMEREEEGLLETHGPVIYKRRKVYYDVWED